MSTKYNTHTRDWRNTTSNYVDITQSVHASFVDVYINKFFSSYSVSYGSVDIVLAKLKHSRGVWGWLLNTYPQSLFYLTCCRRIITKCTVLKKRWSLLGKLLVDRTPDGLWVYYRYVSAHAYGFCLYFV